MTQTEKYVAEKLFSLSDADYKAFHAKLMPTVNPDVIIGVRTPVLRKFAKEFFKDERRADFLDTLPHKYYEQNNLHGFLIEQIKDYDEVIRLLDRFLPYVDNWATCDLMRPKIFAKNKDRLIEKIKLWIKSGDTYTVRFGIEMLMAFYLDDDFSEEYLQLVCSVKTDEYYVNMMIAWYFATALAKQYDVTLPYIEQHKLDNWCNNKAIQKAVESYRITDSQKAYLRTLKLKKES